MTPEVMAAIDEIADAFSGCQIDRAEDGKGGALVTVHRVPLEDSPYRQPDTWVGFHVTHTYPYADIYPHFVRHDLSRRDGKPLGEGTSAGTFQGQAAVQVSRRAKRHNPVTDTALLKLCKVLRWLKSRA